MSLEDDPTREYLIAEGIADPDALDASIADIVNELLPEDVDRDEDNLLLHLDDDKENPEARIQGIPPTRPASSIPNVSIFAAGSLSSVSTLLEKIDVPTMSLQGIDALLLPKESREVPSEGSESATPSSAAEAARQGGLMPKAVDEDDLQEREASIPSVDHLLKLGLTAQKQLILDTKQVTKELKNANSRGDADTGLLCESLPQPRSFSTPTLVPRPPNFSPPSFLHYKKAEEEDLTSMIQNNIYPPETPDTNVNHVGPGMETFDRWQNNVLPDITPAASNQASSSFSSLVNDLSPVRSTPSYAKELAVPLIPREERKRSLSMANVVDSPSSDSVPLALEIKRIRASEGGEDASFDATFDPSTFLVKAESPVSVMTREKPSGNPLSDMLFEVPALTSTKRLASSDDDWPKTPGISNTTQSGAQWPSNRNLKQLGLGQATDMSLDNINLWACYILQHDAEAYNALSPSAEGVLARINPKDAEDQILEDLPQIVGVRPSLIMPAAYSRRDEEEDEIDELMSSQSTEDPIEFTPPEVLQARKRNLAGGEKKTFEEIARDCGDSQERDELQEDRVEDAFENTVDNMQLIENDASQSIQAEDNFRIPATQILQATQPSQSPEPEQSQSMPASRESSAMMNTQALFDILADSQAWEKKRSSNLVQHEQAEMSQYMAEEAPQLEQEQTPDPFEQAQSYIPLNVEDTQPLQIFQDTPSAGKAGEFEPSFDVAMESQMHETASPKQEHKRTTPLLDLTTLARQRRRRLQKSDSPETTPSTVNREKRTNLNDYLALRARPELRVVRFPTPPPKPLSPIRTAIPQHTAPQAPPEVVVKPKKVTLSRQRSSVIIPDLTAGDAELIEETKRQISRYPKLQCFGSFRLLQNGPIDRALENYHIDLLYPGESNEAAKARRAANSAFEAASYINEPDIILSPTSCAIFYKLSKIFRWTSITEANGATHRVGHSQIIMSALESFSVAFDKVTIIFEAFDPPDPVTGVVPPSSTEAFTPPVIKALETLKNHIAELQARQRRDRSGTSIEVELCYAGNAHQAAEITRARIDDKVAQDPYLGQILYNMEIFQQLPLNRLSGHLIAMQAGGLENFVNLPEADRSLHFRRLLGSHRMSLINDMCRPTSFLINAEGFQEAQMIGGEVFDEDEEQDLPSTPYEYCPEPAIDAYIQEQQEIQQIFGSEDSENTQAVLQRQMEEFEMSRRQGFQVSQEQQQNYGQEPLPPASQYSPQRQHLFFQVGMDTSRDVGQLQEDMVNDGGYNEVQNQYTIPMNQYTTPTKQKRKESLDGFGDFTKELKAQKRRKQR